jgi:hypothetical protein
MNMNPLPLIHEIPTETVENAVLRVGLISSGMILLHLAFMIVSAAPLSASPGAVTAVVISGILGLLLVSSGGLLAIPSSLRWLVLLACLLNLGVRSVLWGQDPQSLATVTVDPALYTDLAADLLRHGENPYTWDLSGAFTLYRTSYEGSTAQLDAANESHYSYPALPILLAASAKCMNLRGTFEVLLLAYAATLVVLFLSSPRFLQPLILLPLAIGIDMTSLNLIGVTDILWAGLLVGTIVSWRRRTLRAILFGLAACTKQIPWFLLPFLVMHVYREATRDEPIQEVLHFLVVSGATFMTVNAPFIVWNLEEWLRGIGRPLQNDLILFSQGGLSSISQLGLVRLPKSFYLVATLSVYGLLMFCYWRHYGVVSHTIWVVPGIVLWCLYRSLVSYWAYGVFPALAALATRAPPGYRSENAGASWKLTLAVVSMVVGALLGASILLSQQAAPVEVDPIFPMFTELGRVTEMDVEVVNRSLRTLKPRFAIQSRHASGNPLPWYIDRGPRSLPPGRSAIYTIASNRHDRAFYAHDAAHLIVTDAGGDYSLSSISPIAPDYSFLWPDAIPNPAYRYWDSHTKIPASWHFATEPPDAGMTAPGDEEGTLRLTLQARDTGASWAAVENLVTFPANPFGIWVYPDPPLDNSSSVIYGLEIDDGDHRLWFVFGPQDYTGSVGGNHHVVSRIVPSRTWSLQQIDVVSAYAEAGWDFPVLERADYRGLSADFRLVNLRLFLLVDGSRDTHQARFGPIEQNDYRIKPEVLMAETLDDPTGYYTRLADVYREERNYSRALQAYERALDFSDEPDGILSRIGQLKRRVTEGSVPDR